MSAQQLRKRCRTILEREEGSATAEFAVVLPAVILILGLVLGSMHLVSLRLVFTSAAHEIARIEARGEPGAVEDILALLPQGGRGTGITRERVDDLLCVTLSARPGRGLLAGVAVSARGCALEQTP